MIRYKVYTIEMNRLKKSRKIASPQITAKRSAMNHFIFNRNFRFALVNGSPSYIGDVR